jgi:hypothetical protein
VEVVRRLTEEFQAGMDRGDFGAWLNSEYIADGSRMKLFVGGEPSNANGKRRTRKPEGRKIAKNSSDRMPTKAPIEDWKKRKSARDAASDLLVAQGGRRGV